MCSTAAACSVERRCRWTHPNPIPRPRRRLPPPVPPRLRAAGAWHKALQTAERRDRLIANSGVKLEASESAISSERRLSRISQRPSRRAASTAWSCRTARSRTSTSCRSLTRETGFASGRHIWRSRNPRSRLFRLQRSQAARSSGRLRHAGRSHSHSGSPY